MRFASRLLLTLAVAAVHGGCALDAIDQDNGVNPHALVDKELLWPDPGNIPVCWEAGAESYADEKQWVRSAIAGTWTRANPKIKFTGWGGCTAQSKGIRIRVANSSTGPYSYLGTTSIGMKPSMQLSFDLAGQDEIWKDAIPTFLDPCLESDANRKKCIQAIAIHEFGHALGFQHEQNRSDVPKPCDEDQAYTSGGGWVIDGFDSASIMNYCKKGRVLVTSLSAGDAKAAKELYSDKLTQDPGRPDVYAWTADGSPLEPGKEVSIEVYYPDFTSTEALPDPKTALRAKKDDGAFQTIPAGDWVTDAGGSSTTATWTLPASDTAYTLVVEWNGKYATQLEVAPFVPQPGEQ